MINALLLSAKWETNRGLAVRLREFMNRVNSSFFIALFALLVLPINTQAQVVKWTDEHGKVHYGDKAPEQYRESSEPVVLNEPNLINSENQPLVQRRDVPAKNRPADEGRSESEDKNWFSDEAECQEVYGMSCDRVNNWRSYAEAACKQRKQEKNCADESYLETKYKPRTLEKIQRSAATASRKRTKEERMKELKCTGQRRLRDCPGYHSD